MVLFLLHFILLKKFDHFFDNDNFLIISWSVILQSLLTYNTYLFSFDNIFPLNRFFFFKKNIYLIALDCTIVTLIVLFLLVNVDSDIFDTEGFFFNLFKYYIFIYFFIIIFLIWFFVIFVSFLFLYIFLYGFIKSLQLTFNKVIRFYFSTIFAIFIFFLVSSLITYMLVGSSFYNSFLFLWSI